jgi:hypothetical protein
LVLGWVFAGVVGESLANQVLGVPAPAGAVASSCWVSRPSTELRHGLSAAEPRLAGRSGREGALDLWFPDITLPVGFGQTRSPRGLPELVMVTGYARRLSRG